MATERQKKAVKNLVENGGIVSKAMRDAWYTDATAKTPQKLTESVWFKEALDEYWLTESLIVEALVDDIKKKKQNRKPELELWAKIRWMLIDRNETNINWKVESNLNEWQMLVIANRILNEQWSNKSNSTAK